MSWKRTLLLFLILGVVISFYYQKSKTLPFLLQSKAISLSTTPESPYILQLKDGETINHIVLEDFSKKTEVVFEATKPHVWRITKPVNYPAEPIIVDGFNSLLRLTPRVRELSFEGLSPSEFGFDHPRFKVCLSTNMVQKEKCLMVGSDAVVAQARYARWDDEPKFFLVGQTFVDAFDKSLYSLRRKQIFALLEGQVRSVHFRSTDRELDIRRDGKRWLLEKPRESIVGSQAVNEILSQLNNLFVKEFLDHERWQDVRLGFKSASYLVRVVFDDGSEQVLIRGNEAAGRDAYYGRTQGEDAVFLISLGKFKKVENAFRALVS